MNMCKLHKVLPSFLAGRRLPKQAKYGTLNKIRYPMRCRRENKKGRFYNEKEERVMETDSDEAHRKSGADSCHGANDDTIFIIGASGQGSRHTNDLFRSRWGVEYGRCLVFCIRMGK